ncbi:MAG: pre-16S rRNA-processing nuclease YqgF, partial [Candidatus Velthaea sp.]
MRVLGLDPGTRKCGFAVIDAVGAVPTALGIAPLAELGSTLRALAAAHRLDIAAVGQGTNAAVVCAAVRALGL